MKRQALVCIFKFNCMCVLWWAGRQNLNLSDFAYKQTRSRYRAQKS